MGRQEPYLQHRQRMEVRQRDGHAQQELDVVRGGAQLEHGGLRGASKRPLELVVGFERLQRPRLQPQSDERARAQREGRDTGGGDGGEEKDEESGDEKVTAQSRKRERVCVGGGERNKSIVHLQHEGEVAGRILS